MPVSADLELPIKFVRAVGPAVDALDSRKEHNDHYSVTADELRRNYEAVQAEMFDGFKTLTASPIRR